MRSAGKCLDFSHSILSLFNTDTFISEISILDLRSQMDQPVYYLDILPHRLLSERKLSEMPGIARYQRTPSASLSISKRYQHTEVIDVEHGDASLSCPKRTLRFRCHSNAMQSPVIVDNVLDAFFKFGGDKPIESSRVAKFDALEVSSDDDDDDYDEDDDDDDDDVTPTPSPTPVIANGDVRDASCEFIVVRSN